MEIEFAAVAQLLAVPARAVLVSALMDGQERTASDLASMSRVARSTASGHLAQLLAGGLVRVERRGRTRCYALSSPEVAQALESFALLCPASAPQSFRQVKASAAMRAARTCYDHLAGRLGVAVTKAMVARGWLDDSLTMYPASVQMMKEAGIDIGNIVGSSRPLTRPCLDWTERQVHVAGALGAALARTFVEERWVVRSTTQRSLSVTAAGKEALTDRFGIAWL